MKIFFKLDQASDWKPATEIFSRDELKDKAGNQIPIGSSSDFNSIYFKKPLFCTELRIMMNQPVKKKSFSLEKVLFYQKISNGIIRTSAGAKKSCWYINSDVPRDGLNIFIYPCLKTVMFATGNELFEMTTSKKIRSIKSGLCVGYNEKTKEVLLKTCQRSSRAYSIEFNLDSSMYFDRLIDTAIYMDRKSDVINYINQDTEIIATSEADRNQFKKENILFKGENYWASVPGQQDVTIQFIFGKIKCDDCPENGRYEKRIVDIIRISWEREPIDFSVYLWNPGFSWKNIATFKKNTEKATEISLVAETATGIMIRMTKGNSLPDFGNQVTYAIKSVTAGFKGYKLKYGEYKNQSVDTRLFEFEVQSIVPKGNNTKNFDSAFQKLGQIFEKSVNAYKLVKSSFVNIDKVKRQGAEMCKKLNSFSSTIGEEAISSLTMFKQTSLKMSENSAFTASLSKMGEVSASASFSSSSSSSFSIKASFLELQSQTESQSTTQEINMPSAPLNIRSSGISSKPKDPSEEVFKPLIGTKEAPGENCLHIRKLDQNSLSGFYYIKPECRSKPFRVFCDFTIYGDAVDIYIFKDGSYLPNPDLTYLNINKAKDVRMQCAKYGLFPIELQNQDMVSRILQLIIASGMDLSKDIYVPLGFDFSCKNNKCSNIYNSINSGNSLPIMNLFSKARFPGQTNERSGRFAGLGKINETSMAIFDSSNVKISALICSSNKFKGEYSENPSVNITCDMNVSNNQDTYSEGKDVVAVCPKGCQTSDAPIFGAGLYHGDSSICKAAIHQGVIGGDGGKVVVRVQTGGENYNGTLLNGIKSHNHTNDGLKAFIVVKYVPNCPNKPSSFIEEVNSPKGISFVQQDEYIRLESLAQSNLGNYNNYANNNDNSNVNNLIRGLINNNNNTFQNQMRFAQTNSLGADSQAAANMGGLTANAAAAASDLLGLVNNSAPNVAAQALNGLGSLGSNALQSANAMANAVGNGISGGFGGGFGGSMGGFGGMGGSFGMNGEYKPPMPKADPGSSKGLAGQPTSPEDMAAQLSLSSGLGGTYKFDLKQSASGNSISDPGNNPNANMNGPGPNGYDNIPYAMAKLQQAIDPNLASSVSASGMNSAMNMFTNANSPAPEVYQVPDNRLGKGTLTAGIDLGASSLDLSIGKPYIDPTATSGDGNAGGLTISAGLTVSASLSLGLNPETTQSAKEELLRLYDSSFGSYIKKMKRKTEMISATVSNFSAGLNQAISGGGSLSIKSADLKLSSGMGISLSASASASASLSISSSSSSSKSSACSISTIQGN